MEDLRDDSTTKKKEFPSLLFLSARLVYYININTIYNLEKTVNHVRNCKCHLFSGCEKPNSSKDYCDLCSLSYRYFSYFEEKGHVSIT